MSMSSNMTELKRSWLAPLLIGLYRLTNAQRRWRIARVILGLCLRLEGGAMYSYTARQLMREFHQVEVGAYSYGELFDPALVPPGVKIGRYVSVARGARLIVQNHPLDRISTHPLCYESQPGVAATADIPAATVQIGNDVWIGCNAVITPGCHHVGDGAVVGAGAVVTKDVDNYAIVAGSPAKEIRQRFGKETIEVLQESRWWERSLTDVKEALPVLSGLTRQPVTDPAPLASIVIPAHNEEEVIERCLRNVLATAQPGELEVVVACNGCVDETARIAERFGDDVTVVETPAASKIAALNLGDQQARHFPRFYVDADVLITTTTIRKTVAALQGHQPRAAAPKRNWDLSRSNWLVRCFYAIWKRQPYFDHGSLGAGVYAMNESGRARFGAFPEITADDEFVRQQFDPSERTTTADCCFTIVPPRTWTQLVRIKTRSRRGNLELREQFPELGGHSSRSRLEFARRLLVRPWLWPASVVYTCTVICTSVMARQTMQQNRESRIWERDLSSRTA